MTPQKYGLNTVSGDHGLRSQEEGAIQPHRGKWEPLERLEAGYLLVVSSLKEGYGEKTPCQRSTALIEITEDVPYPAAVSETFFSPQCPLPA